MNKLFKVLFLMFSLNVSVTGCCGPKLHTAGGNRLLPNHWSGKLKPLGQEAATIKLSYDALYVEVCPPNDVDRYRWARFWPEGRMHTWARSKSDANTRGPSSADGDNFYFMGAGLYSIVGTEFTAEFVTPSETIGCPSKYLYEKGRVNSDGSFSIFFKSPIFGQPLIEQRYFPVPVAGMVRQPDW